MNVLILAAGLSSRLSKITHNCLPKYLIDLDGTPALFHLLHYWENYTKTIYLVIHSKFREITEFYVNMFLVTKNGPSDEGFKIHILVYDRSDGTAYTLYHILKNHSELMEKNLLLSWCDIFPSRPLPLNANFKPEITVFTYGNKCRYGFFHSSIKNMGSEGGNIIGITHFYKNVLLQFSADENPSRFYNKDIVDFLMEWYPIHEYKTDVHDFGDEEKYMALQKGRDSPSRRSFACRHFNKITLLEKDLLLKEAIGEQGISIIQKEKQFYQFLGNNHPLFPKIYKTYATGFLMEYKRDSIELYKYIRHVTSVAERRDLLEIVFKDVQKIHNFVPQRFIEKAVFLKDIVIETFEKVICRIEKIRPLLAHFNTITHVNGREIADFHTILNACHKTILDYYGARDGPPLFHVSLLLGDCQFSNILIHPLTKILTFIDPRGYFGNTDLFGPVEYDYAKILYALSGYDSFNADPFFCIDGITETHLDFTIPHCEEDMKHPSFQRVHFALLVIIWMSLAEYNKNNIWKCITSYYHGLELGTKYGFVL